MIKIAKIASGIIFIFAMVLFTLTSFLVGYIKGYDFGRDSTTSYYQELIADKVSATLAPKATTKPSTAPAPTTAAPKPQAKVAFGGPQLWEAVNKRRVELGVNPLSVREELCTIASIRLNRMLELGKLDGHEGFSNLPNTRPDLKWIFDKYNLSEFLVAGAESAQEAVSLWENSLGHKQLMSGGEYVWGCIYAQAGFGVAIAAY
ncbi:MAG: hypothetical protein UX13_C0037G0019 [Candidatus Woesebacteria bacterium GW2011_GWB1_45_5]|uniref:SCP domain-containing protein n=1 Tax=Candidatus Woesebacteria bacterium GW2011_GWB1_45_5 TaxID=1618581 RepID=A0A0G1QLN5_9BACT|nr:MAG: hypothetical protein UX13_C0037G0019 [Candidatus Woesebacteria bacterium GW2011_GWB1_45_5]